jgi:hypothetical protein
VTWQPLPDDAPLDHEALTPPASGFAELPDDAQLDAPEGAGFTDEQKQQILGFLPKAKDAADLEQFASQLTAGKAHIGNAGHVLEQFQKGRRDFAFSDPTVRKEAPKDDPSMLEGVQASGKAFTEHFANALAFDYGPEVGGFIHTIIHGGSLDNNVAHERAILEGDSEGHGLASTLGELGGVAATLPIGLAGGAKAAGYAVEHGSQVVDLAKAAAGGAVYGSGAAGPGHRLGGAAEGAILAPVVGTALKAPLAAYDAAKSVLQGSPGLARRIVAKAIKADENTPASVGADMMAAHGNDVPMMLADSGENTRGLLAAAGRSSGPARTLARDALETRQAGLAERVTNTIERDLGPVSNPHEVADGLMTQARQTAAPIYEKFYSQAPVSSSAVDSMIQRPSMQKALKNASRIAQEEGADPEALGLNGAEVGRSYSPQALDYIKRGMDDVVESYRDKTTGKLVLDTEGRAVNNTLRSYMKVVDGLYPDYAKAREAYGGPVSGIGAMNAGRKALNMTADDLEARMRSMTPFEKQMFALGARRAMAEAVDSKGDTANVIAAITGTGKKRAMLARLFGDRPTFERFVKTLNQEKEGFRTFKQALTGSPTAANLSDDRALDLATAVVETAATGVPWRLAMKHALKFGVGKVGDKTKQQVAALLSETDPARFRELADELRNEAQRRGLFKRKVRVFARGAGNAAVASQAQ